MMELKTLDNCKLRKDNLIKDVIEFGESEWIKNLLEEISPLSEGELEKDKAGINLYRDVQTIYFCLHIFIL